MTACTAKEELEWRCRLASPSFDRAIQKEPNWFSWLSLDIKPLGTVFGKPGKCVAENISYAEQSFSVTPLEVDDGTLFRR